MDDDFGYVADLADGDDNRTFHRNIADRDLDTGTDFDFYS